MIGGFGFRPETLTLKIESPQPMTKSGGVDPRLVPEPSVANPVIDAVAGGAIEEGNICFYYSKPKLAGET